MDQIEEYWKTMKPTSDLFHSPNVSLFRLIGSAFGSLKNKNVLEIGFGYGADLA